MVTEDYFSIFHISGLKKAVNWKWKDPKPAPVYSFFFLSFFVTFHLKSNAAQQHLLIMNNN